jgi:hypothetical protein
LAKEGPSTLSDLGGYSLHLFISVWLSEDLLKHLECKGKSDSSSGRNNYVRYSHAIVPSSLKTTTRYASTAAKEVAPKLKKAHEINDTDLLKESIKPD